MALDYFSFCVSFKELNFPQYLPSVMFSFVFSLITTFLKYTYFTKFNRNLEYIFDMKLGAWGWLAR